MIRIVLFISAFLIGVSAFGQKKKYRTYGIHHLTETTVNFKGEEQERYTSEERFFDDDGEWVKKIDYFKDGRVKRIETRRYEKGILVEESLDEPNDRDAKERNSEYWRVIYTFDKDKLVREAEYDRDGQLVEIKEYRYDKFGEEQEEIKLSPEEEVIEREVYTYDSRGLKILKKTLKPDGTVTEEKHYAYE